MVAKTQPNDPYAEVRRAWLQICKLIRQTRESIYADRITKNGKRKPRKIEKTKERDGANQSIRQRQTNGKLKFKPHLSKNKPS